MPRNLRKLPIPRIPVIGSLLLIGLAACTVLRTNPPPGPDPAAAAPAAARAPEKVPPPSKSDTPPPAEAATAAAAAASAESSPVKPGGAGVSKPTVARAGPPAVVPPGASSVAAASALRPGSATPAPPALDLAALEQRLRDTRAIGVFTKLSLKNQVDDLLDELRAFHGGQGRLALKDLRQHYDLLLMKVLSLLQDGDPPLATAILASREIIWGILADPDKFRKIQLG